MDVNGAVFLPLVLSLKLSISTYTVQGFECHVAKEPIIFTGDTTHTANFMWDCLLLSNESLLSVMWLKEDLCMAKATDGIFTPCEGYTGRVEILGTFGISLHNISRNDSGHYNTVILLSGSLYTYLPCQPTYLPVLPEKCSGYCPVKAQASAIDENSSLYDQQGPSTLNIGLICGLVPVTILGLGAVVWRLYCRRRCTNQRENESMSPEQTEMFQAPNQ